jgi:hypothetical protein
MVMIRSNEVDCHGLLINNEDWLSENNVDFFQPSGSNLDPSSLHDKTSAVGAFDLM